MTTTLFIYLKAMKCNKAFRRVLWSPAQATNIPQTLVTVDIHTTFYVSKSVKMFNYQW